MKNKKTDLFTIYKMLEDGVHFYRYYEHNGSLSDLCSLYADNKYIRWCNYGSSAEPKTLSELAWIILVIFECNLNEFIKIMKAYKYDKYGGCYEVKYSDYIV